MAGQGAAAGHAAQRDGGGRAAWVRACRSQVQCRSGEAGSAGLPQGRALGRCMLPPSAPRSLQASREGAAPVQGRARLRLCAPPRPGRPLRAGRQAPGRLIWGACPQLGVRRPAPRCPRVWRRAGRQGAAVARKCPAPSLQTGVGRGIAGRGRGACAGSRARAQLRSDTHGKRSAGPRRAQRGVGWGGSPCSGRGVCGISCALQPPHAARRRPPPACSCPAAPAARSASPGRRQRAGGGT